MSNFESKPNIKELNKLKKKLFKTLSLDKLKEITIKPLCNHYQNFKKKRKEEIAKKIKKKKIEQEKQLLREKKQKIREEKQKLKDEEKKLKDLEVKKQQEANQKIREEKERLEAKEKLRLYNEKQQKKMKNKRG